MLNFRKILKKELETSTAETALILSEKDLKGAEKLADKAEIKTVELETLLKKNHFAENFRRTLGRKK